MSELWGHVIGVFILFMMFSFIGIWVWVWQKRHKPLFDQLSVLPMEDVFESHDSLNRFEEKVK